MSLFEIIMLLSFGAAWPAAIVKSFRSKSTGGKSIIFNYVIFTGYISGIFHKIFFHYDFVIIFYILNAIMVLVDTVLYYRNRHTESIQAHQ